MPVIAFLGHNASRTGAPIVLLDLIRWLRRETGLRSELRLLAGGPLVDDYREVVPTSVVRVGRTRSRLLWAVERSGDRLTRRSPSSPARLPQVAHLRKAASLCRNADLIYANTAVAASVLQELPSRPPTIIHLHEMSYALHRSLTPAPCASG